MANNEDKLNRLFRDGLADFAKDPPPKVWAGIKQGLILKNIYTLKFLTSLNIYSVSVFVAAAAVSGFFAGKAIQNQHQDIVVSQVKNEISYDKNNVTKSINSKSDHQLNNEKDFSTQNSIKEQPDNINSKLSMVASKPTQMNSDSKQKITYAEVTKSEDFVNSKPESDNVYSRENKPQILSGDTHIVKNTEKQDTKPNNSEQSDKKPVQQKVAEEKSAEQAPSIIPRKPSVNQGIFGELFVGPALISYQYSESEKNPNLGFVQQNQENETPALSYTAGLEIGYGMKHLFVQTGLNYSDYRSKSVFEITSSKSSWENNFVLDSVFVPDSLDPHYDYFYDTIRVFATYDTQEYHSSKNFMQYIEIPVLIGYRFYHNKFSYALTGGVAFGYLFSSGGTTLNPDMKSITSNTPEAIPFKQWNLFLLMRAEGAYLFKNNMSIFVRPGFKYNISSVFEDYYPVQKNFYTLDLHVGLRYNF